MPPESPLRALLEAIGEQLHELEEAIEGLYEDAFVETPRRWWPPGFLAALRPRRLAREPCPLPAGA